MNTVKRIISGWRTLGNSHQTAEQFNAQADAADLELADQAAQIEALKAALWKSDPWIKNSDEGFTCQHCGHDYIYMAKTELPDEHHEADCIWLLSRPYTEKAGQG